MKLYERVARATDVGGQPYSPPTKNDAGGPPPDLVYTLHPDLCDTETYTLGHSNDVFVNTYGVHRLTDLNRPHRAPEYLCLLTHTMPIEEASYTVFANALGVARVDDPYLNCGVVASGSPDVWAGGGIV